MHCINYAMDRLAFEVERQRIYDAKVKECCTFPLLAKHRIASVRHTQERMRRG